MGVEIAGPGLLPFHPPPPAQLLQPAATGTLESFPSRALSGPSQPLPPPTSAPSGPLPTAPPLPAAAAVARLPTRTPSRPLPPPTAHLLLLRSGALYAPMDVIEELDRFKGQNNELGRNARQVVRTLDRLRGQGSRGFPSAQAACAAACTQT